MKDKRIKSFIEWLLHMLSYSLILMTMCVLFKKSIYIDNSCFGIWSFIISIIIYILNKTIKPLLFWLTLPITGVTLGIFYPFINVIILGIVAKLLGSHFDMLGGLPILFLIAILISIMNFIMNKIIDNLFGKVK